MVRAGAATQEALVLRGHEDARAVDRGAGEHDAIVVLRADAPAGEMRRRPGRGEQVVDGVTLPGSAIAAMRSPALRARSAAGR